VAETPDHNTNADAGFVFSDELDAIRGITEALASRHASLSQADRDDIYQMVVMQLAGYARQGVRPESGSWLPLARAIACRRAIDLYRARGKERNLQRSLASRLDTLSRPPRAPTDNLDAHLKAAVRLLPPDDQLVLRLRFVEDLKLREIAEATEKPLHAVYTQLERAVKDLRDILRSRAGEDESLRALLDEAWPDQ